MRFCDARVADPRHRLLAGAIDVSLVVIAFGILLFLLEAGPARIDWSLKLAPYGVAGFAALLFFYKALWLAAATDPPGMRWTRLRLMNFDGEPASPSERLFRFASGCLGVLAGGLGLIWALADEEHLAWHDHISKTFPTPDYFPGTPRQ